MTRSDSYYQAAGALREAIHINRADYFFGSNVKNRIVYLFDTNVMESYLRTAKRETSGNSITFGDLFDDRVAMNVDHRLTTEFLLSGGLPGQHFGESIYLSSFHWNELIRRIEKLDREVEKLASGPAKLGQRQLEALDRLNEIADAKAFVADASRIIPAELLEALGRAEAVRRRLHRSFTDRKTVQTLDACHEWHVSKNRVFRNDVLKWAGDLKAIREETDRHRPRNESLKPSQREADELRRAEDERRKIENDAQTLAGIEALYRENDEAGGDSRSLAFHFVTLDQSILKAVHDRRAELARQGIPLFVRHPRVFSPILNFSGMTRALTGVQWDRSVVGVFAEVERAIEQLFELDYRRDLSRDRQSGAIQKNIQRWEEAARQLITINAAFFAEDFAAIESVIKRLQRRDSITAGGELLKETIARIRTDHALLLSDHALDHLSRNLSELAKGEAAPGVRRAPVKIVGVQLDASAARIEASQSLDEMLDGILGRSKVREIRRTIEAVRTQLHKEWNTSAGQLLAACVFLAIGGWQSARECADRSRHLIHGPTIKNPIWREASYAKALAIRFSLRSRSDFDEAGTSLLRNVSNWSFSQDVNSRYACLRDRIENAALQQSISVLQAIENATPFVNFGANDTPFEILTPEEIRDNFDESAFSMQETQEIIDLDYSGEISNPYLLRSLRRQLAINVVGAHIFRKLLGNNISASAFDIEQLKPALATLIKAGGFVKENHLKQDRPPPPIGQIYGTCAQSILNPDEAPVETTLELIEGIVKDNILPYSDIVELKYLRENLLLAS